MTKKIIDYISASPDRFFVSDLAAQKASDITRVPLEYLLKLRDMGWIKTDKLRASLVKYDYKALEKTGKLTPRQIVAKLSGIYRIPQATISSIVKARIKAVFYCRRCGNEMTQRENMENGGLCDRCFGDTAE